MSDLYSDSRVVQKANGAPTPMAQPTAMSAALPVASWCTANEALIPAPFTFLPCSYRFLTEGPIPFGATRTTLISSLNCAFSFSITPRRNPWDNPSVDPGFMAARILGYILDCAASEIRQMTRSDLEMTSKTSPRVPSASLNPTWRASSLDEESGLSPITTLVSMPASARESRRFWAWAGACEPHPMTPICLMPLKASGRSAYLSRPPL
mmetsp:Transcript_8977/g.24177  ORF Transcript_8977/g.24177 Transcript_8977/m.24177 type:complete len:209 (-) Transcript_8977:234-860(-)